MGEADEIRSNLRQLLELEKASGVDWLPLPAEQTGDGKPETAVPAEQRSGSQNSPIPTSTLQPTEPPAQGSRLPTPDSTTTASPWTAPADLITRPPAEAIAAIAADIAACQRCGLCSGRTRTVPGEGSATPELVFVGEGPGRDEDLQGRPFVGPAGQLLDKMITAMGFARGEVHICNAVKCRPPGNRNPEPDELAACHPFLMAQLAVLRPKVICTLGNIPLRTLFGPDTPGITRIRGKRLEWQGIPVYPTFHPSYLLRNEAAKKPAWEDLKAVLAELGREPPARR